MQVVEIASLCVNKLNPFMSRFAALSFATTLRKVRNDLCEGWLLSWARVVTVKRSSPSTALRRVIPPASVIGMLH